jgi:Spy/CpxP family protein refolding chaperone
MISRLSRPVVVTLWTAALLAGLAVAAFSYPTMGHGHMGRHGMNSLGIPMRLVLKSANLTDAQKQQVHQIFQSRRTALKSEFEQLKAARQQIADKYAAPGPVSASDLSAPLSQITQLRDQMAQEQLQDAIAIRNLLTPAQLQQVAQNKTKLDQIRGEMKSLFQQNGVPSPSAAASPSTASPQSGATATTE